MHSIGQTINHNCHLTSVALQEPCWTEQTGCVPKLQSANIHTSNTLVHIHANYTCHSFTTISCPLTKLNGGLSRLHSADEDAVSWLTNYGKWHAYEKKKIHHKRNIMLVLASTAFTEQNILPIFRKSRHTLVAKGTKQCKSVEAQSCI